MGGRLQRQDVVDYWLKKCNQPKCRVCGSMEEPMVAFEPMPVTELWSDDGSKALVRKVSLFCPSCGVETSIARDRIAYWKETGD